MADRIIFCLTVLYLFGSPEATPLCLRKKLVIDHDGGADDALAITMSLLYEKYFGGSCGGVWFRVVSDVQNNTIPFLSVDVVRGDSVLYAFYHHTAIANPPAKPGDYGKSSKLEEAYVQHPKVVALTTTYGNVNLKQAIINSDRILALCKRKDIPIYSGARQSLVSGIKSDEFFGIDGLGDDGYSPSTPVKVQKEPAAVALLKLSKKYEGKLIIVAIGPVTNIALAARLDPEFIGRLAQLYIGGGHIYSDDYPKPEFNALMDPEAYHIVANSSSVDKVTLVPYSQVYDTLNISLDWRINVLGKIQTPIMEALNGFERKSIPKQTSWALLDPATSAIALDNDIVDEFRNTKNDIVLEGARRGINTNNFSSTNPNARLVYTANEDKYKKFLLDVYSAELKPRI